MKLIGKFLLAVLFATTAVAGSLPQLGFPVAYSGGSSPGIGQYTHVISGYASGFTTPNPAGSTTTGDTFVVIAVSNQLFSTGTITDAFSNTYTHEISDLQVQSTYRYLNAWICQSCTGGANHTVTVTFASSQYSVGAFIDITNAGASGLDQNASTANLTESGTTLNLQSVTTTAAAKEIVVAFVGTAANVTLSAPTNSFTLGDQVADASSGTLTLGWAYYVTAATGTYSTSLTSSAGSQSYGVGTFSIK